MANWDEDAVTMAVEAGRDCLPAADPIADRAFVDAVYFASTTMPFADRQNGGIAARALSLAEDISCVDVTASQRAGTSALIAALDARGGRPRQGAAGARRREAQGARRLGAGAGLSAMPRPR